MGAREQGIDTSQQRYQVVARTLLFITHGDEVLLLKGAPDKHLWANRYNGIGGHVERGETIYDAAVRETAEETGIDHLDNLRLCGVITIDTGNPTLGILLFVFTASSPTRKVFASHEGTPEWLDWDTLAPELMVDDLPVILPHALAMQPGAPPFYAHYWYDNQDTLQIAFA
jgi:8-oxo-dGTP diphosphatase